VDIVLNNLRVPVEQDGVEAYVRLAAEMLQIDEGGLGLVRILSKSLDARSKKQFYYEMSVVVHLPDSFANRGNLPLYTENPKTRIKSVTFKDRPIIVGFGPAGMFAALELVERGAKPIIFERGKRVEERDADVDRFVTERTLDPESNIQFGEGGAGTYSDGKLFSRIKNAEHVNRVLDTFVRFGAPAEIGYISKPHLGTDVLRRIVVAMRTSILERGGEIHYGAKMTDILVRDGAAAGVVINGEKEYHSSGVYLGVGHSARDTFELLHAKNVAMEQKPIAVGVRIEHPAGTINLMRYGKKYRDFKGIGAATYSFTHTDRKVGRGVYTFCMCPGGEVVNASSENGMLAVNGMSYAARASAFSNAAIVVTCGGTDYGSPHPLAGIGFQRAIERAAFAAGGGTWAVPAQNLMDFLAGRPSRGLNENSCKTGTVPADLREIFPKFVPDSLAAAFGVWQEAYPLFVSEQGILLGAETRTSCPVRIVRGADFESVSMKNLYPIGEGSGYAGGITSSAVDGIKAVEASTAQVA
jgi:uncharacterized FAD-dependent dehydrogenase